MLRKWVSTCSCLALSTLAACAHVSEGSRAPQGDATAHPAAAIAYQEPCYPRDILPPEGVPVRGKVIMVHGFTACPQQFFEWSERLALLGWVSHLVTMPGHGRVALASGVEDFESIPGYGDFRPYEALAEEVIELARADELPTVVVGVSVGGAVVLDAVLRSPEDFEEAMLISPFFAVSQKIGRVVGLPLAGGIPFLKNKIIGWGAPCLEEMKRGRGGVCNFRLHHISTAQKYGKKVAEASRPVRTRIQLVGVHEDPAASNEWIFSSAQKLGWKQGGPRVSACLYQKGANHSLMSRFDAPDENKFWMDAILRDATNFVTRGSFFPSTDGTARVFATCEI